MISAGVSHAKPRHHESRTAMANDEPIRTSTPAPGPDLAPAPTNHYDGLQVDVEGEEAADRTLAAIEMAGEEVAAGWKPAAHEPLAPEVRYLHVSRTIHELILDRNRSVGIFLFMASLLVGATTALLNVPATVRTFVPLPVVQYWSLPATFGTLTVVGAFMSLILVRARIGLIYEVAKMNALLGLPTTRVRRINPFSIFFLMYSLVVLLGGVSSGLTAAMFVHWSRSLARQPLDATAETLGGSWIGWAAMVAYVCLFEATYFIMILRATREADLAKVGGGA